MGESSRVGRREGFIFLPHTSIHSTQIGTLEKACIPKKRGEHLHGRFH
jgi:hypothetical protein